MIEPQSAKWPLVGFFIALVAGALLIGWAIFIGQALQYVLFFAGLVMITYFIWVKFLISRGHNVQQLADSVYYLGFLFTLIALFFTLTPVLVTIEGTLGPGLIMERFGVALVTTIAGLIGRIFLVQFQKVPDAAKEEAYDQISAAVHQLAREFDECVIYLRDARDVAGRAIGETTEGATASLLEVTEVASASIQRTSEATMINVAATAEEATGLIRAASAENANSVQEFTKDATGQIQRVINNFAKKVDALRLPEDLFKGVRAKLSDLEDGVEATASTVKDHAEATAELVSHIQECIDGLQGLANEVKGVRELVREMTAARDGAKALTTTFQALDSAVAAYGAALEQHANDVKVSSATVSKELEIIRGYRDQIQEAAAAASQANLRVLEHLVENARYIRDELK